MFYVVLFSFTLGVAFRTLVAVSVPSMVWLMSLSFLIAVVVRKNKGTIFVRHLTITAVCLLFFTFGLLRTEIHYWHFGHSPLQALVGEEVELVGTVIREPEQTESAVRLYVQVDTDVLVVSTERLTAVSYGDEIQLAGLIKKPEAFETDLGRTFQYEKYLLAKGVEYQISFAKVTVLTEKTGSKVITALLSVKHSLMQGIEQVLPEPQAGLGEGLLLGVKQALGSQLESDFRVTGIIHIVVLSGYNVMLVVAFVMYVLGLFLRKRWRIFAGIVAIVAFALIVGLSVTVVRASIMASLLLFAEGFSKNYNVLRALFFAGFVMIFINPFLLLYDIGFQLSFMATLGLLLVAPRFEAMAAKVPAQIGLREFLVATIATQLAVLPLLLYNIGQVSLVAVVVNVLVLPVVPLAMLLTFMSGTLALVSLSVAVPVAYLASITLTYIITVAETFAAIPFAAITVPAFPAWVIVLMYLVPGLAYVWVTYFRKTTSELANWVVEEEKDTAPYGTVSDSLEPPVFFR